MSGPLLRLALGHLLIAACPSHVAEIVAGSEILEDGFLISSIKLHGVLFLPGYPESRRSHGALQRGFGATSESAHPTEPSLAIAYRPLTATNIEMRTTTLAAHHL